MANLDHYAAAPHEPRAEKIIILTADKCHDLEFFYPYYRLVEAGYHVEVATPNGGQLEGKFGMGLKETLKVSDVTPEAYAMLYIPGGQAPEALKKSEDSLQFVRQFTKSGKPVAAICHGAQALAAAGVISGKRISAWPDVEEEVRAAGGVFVNAETVEDGQFITARWPADLPAHLSAVLKRLEGRKEKRSAA